MSPPPPPPSRFGPGLMGYIHPFVCSEARRQWQSVESGTRKEGSKLNVKSEGGRMTYFLLFSGGGGP